MNVNESKSGNLSTNPNNEGHLNVPKIPEEHSEKVAGMMEQDPLNSLIEELRKELKKKRPYYEEADRAREETRKLKQIIAKVAIFFIALTTAASGVFAVGKGAEGAKENMPPNNEYRDSVMTHSVYEEPADKKEHHPNSSQEVVPVDVIEIPVLEGDTLWNLIANNTQHIKEHDIRDIIAATKKHPLNQEAFNEDGTLKVGATIYIPTSAEEKNFILLHEYYLNNSENQDSQNE